MKNIKLSLLKKILSYDGDPHACVYGPPEWWDNDDEARKKRYGENNTQDEPADEEEFDFEETKKDKQ